MIEIPRIFKFRSIPANFFLNKASSPFVGSSRSSMRGRFSNTLAKAARCCSPPDKSYGCMYSNSERSQRLIIF